MRVHSVGVQDGEPRPCLNVPSFLTQITDYSWPTVVHSHIRYSQKAGGLSVFKQGSWLGGSWASR